MAVTHAKTRHAQVETSQLWTACALPGDGPEFRFTTPRRRNTLRLSLRRLVRLWREGAR